MKQAFVGFVLSSVVLVAGCPAGGATAPRRAAASPTACDEGKLDACYELGQRYAADKKNAQARTQARRYFATACNGGLVKGCAELRRLDEAQCGSSVPDACHRLGEMFRLGNRAQKPNPAKARTYYKAACSEGVATACYELGMLWQSGQGGAADETRAKYYLEEACKGKHRQACKKLGR